MIRRRAFIMKLGGSFVAVPVAAAAQHTRDVRRIGWLGMATPEAARHLVQVMENALRERGWVAGKNLIIESRWAEGKYDRLPVLAAELVRLEPQVIVTGPVPAARALKAATGTIPIVMVTVTDPVSEGLISSFARPGGNVTGLTLTPTWELYAKQLELLTEAVPGVRRIAFLWSPANVGAPPGVKTAEDAARRLGIELQVVGARTPEEFEPAFRTMTQARAQALFVLADAMFFAHRRRLADLALANRLPTMFAAREYAEAGGLMSYGADYPDLYRRAAMYVDRILKGSTPADLPVEQPTKFELIVNRAAAKTVGLAVPQSLLLRADHVID